MAEPRWSKERIADARKQEQELLALLNSPERLDAIEELEHVRALLRKHDPDFVEPVSRMGHLKIGDAIIQIMLELGGSCPYGFLLGRLQAEGVARWSSRRIRDLKNSINTFIDRYGWLNCTAPTDGDQAKLMGATVSLSKKFYDKAAAEEKRGKKGKG